MEFVLSIISYLLTLVAGAAVGFLFSRWSNKLDFESEKKDFHYSLLAEVEFNVHGFIHVAEKKLDVLNKIAEKEIRGVSESKRAIDFCQYKIYDLRKPSFLDREFEKNVHEFYFACRRYAHREDYVYTEDSGYPLEQFTYDQEMRDLKAIQDILNPAAVVIRKFDEQSRFLAQIDKTMASIDKFKITKF